METMNLKDTAMQTGGNYRCCLSNFDELKRQFPDEQHAIGSKIKCPHCEAVNILTHLGQWSYSASTR
jgi:hypothetical protein